MSRVRVAPDPVPGLLREWQAFTGCLANQEAIARMESFIAAGGQTPTLWFRTNRVRSAKLPHAQP